MDGTTSVQNIAGATDHERRFHTDFVYTDRRTKARYVFLKYGELLRGTVLDVGCDERHLREHLEGRASYWGIGLGGNPDQKVDLEKGPLPCFDNSFDCVLCMDVLEHLDNPHEVFDELCRVSRRHVIMSLPNPYSSFYNTLCQGDYRPGVAVKFYGLPPEPPADRHKWFFSYTEAEAFVRHRAAKNGLSAVQIDCEGTSGEGRGARGRLRRRARDILFHKDFNTRNLYSGTLWAVLEKGPSSSGRAPASEPKEITR